MLVYEYNASLIRIVDGDTLWLRVDLGFRMFAEMSFRMLGINAPELSTPDGAPARDHLAALVGALGPSFPIQTTKPDKYGRWLVTIPSGPTTINQLMIDDGYAVPYMT